MNSTESKKSSAEKHYKNGKYQKRQQLARVVSLLAMNYMNKFK